jgi:hypothetical protein
MKLCNNTQTGEFLLRKNATENSRNQILSTSINPKDPKPIKYLIKRTGYYCVASLAPDDFEYKAAVEFRNAYGELPAAQIAKLPFYGGLTIAYAVIGM